VGLGAREARRGAAGPPAAAGRLRLGGAGHVRDVHVGGHGGHGGARPAHEPRRRVQAEGCVHEEQGVEEVGLRSVHHEAVTRVARWPAAASCKPAGVVHSTVRLRSAAATRLPGGLTPLLLPLADSPARRVRGHWGANVAGGKQVAGVRRPTLHLHGSTQGRHTTLVAAAH